jgi:hypothetical protein
MLPTLHEADGEHDTAMHGEKGQRQQRSAHKRARLTDVHKATCPSSHADGERGDAALLMEPPENWDSERESADVDVPSPADLLEGGSIPLLETQAHLTLTQPLEEHITQATADVYDALYQLHTEQVEFSVFQQPAHSREPVP